MDKLGKFLLKEIRGEQHLHPITWVTMFGTRVKIPITGTKVPVYMYEINAYKILSVDILGIIYSCFEDSRNDLVNDALCYTVIRHLLKQFETKRSYIDELKNVCVLLYNCCTSVWDMLSVMLKESLRCLGDHSG